MAKKSKKEAELQQQIGELTADLQRLRADFENYRKRTEADITAARQSGQTSAVLRLLPVVDNIERAISHVPKELKDNTWAAGVAALSKNLSSALEAMNVSRINAKAGSDFDPVLHEAISMDESDGQKEVVAEELQAGYTLAGQVIRHAMVRVKKV